MKKLDKLILSAFVGPFFLTFFVVVFLLLIQHMLKYFDDIVGKDIGFGVLANLMFDFSVFMTPIAIPLAVLLSSLMTFGNLGEHFELTAVKSAGISLLRTLWPIFVFVIMLTVLAFYSNNYFVPKAALNAYSLLYDIKQKKPALDLKEGTFYNGIPDLSIKVNKKNADTGQIWDVVIYDHRNTSGNKKVTLADSGRMYTIMNDRYLVLQMYSGHSYIEGQANVNTVSDGMSGSKAESLSRVKFDESKVVFDLSSFNLTRTDKGLFSGNRIMRNLVELDDDVDSLLKDIVEYRLNGFNTNKTHYTYFEQDKIPLTDELAKFQEYQDSIFQVRGLEHNSQEYIDMTEDGHSSMGPVELEKRQNQIWKSQIDNIMGTHDGHLYSDEYLANQQLEVDLEVEQEAVSDLESEPMLLEESVLGSEELTMTSEADSAISIVADSTKVNIEKKLAKFISVTDLSKRDLNTTIERLRLVKSDLQNVVSRIEETHLSRHEFEVQWHKILANSFACMVMFLIGAPLGAIIKRGGLGVPVLISIFFFIVFYVLNIVGEKQAKAGTMDPMIGMWMANILLFPIGLFFLKQARSDARLFDLDFYHVFIDKVKKRFRKR